MLCGGYIKSLVDAIIETGISQQTQFPLILPDNRYNVPSPDTISNALRHTRVHKLKERFKKVPYKYQLL